MEDMKYLLKYILGEYGNKIHPSFVLDIIEEEISTREEFDEKEYSYFENMSIKKLREFYDYVENCEFIVQTEEVKSYFVD